MSADQGKSRFEPPPWEREAFDRFQAERVKARAAEELEEALRQVREPEHEPVDPAQEDGPSDADERPTAKPAEPKAVVPEAKVNSMLAQLRMEEPTPEPNMLLINGVSAVLLVVGLIITVKSAQLFAGARSADAAMNMLAATMSFVIFATGLGFIAGAALLFRKYHS